MNATINLSLNLQLQERLYFELLKKMSFKVYIFLYQNKYKISYMLELKSYYFKSFYQIIKLFLFSQSNDHVSSNRVSIKYKLEFVYPCMISSVATNIPL